MGLVVTGIGEELRDLMQGRLLRAAGFYIIRVINDVFQVKPVAVLGEKTATGLT